MENRIFIIIIINVFTEYKHIEEEKRRKYYTMIKLTLI